MQRADVGDASGRDVLDPADHAAWGQGTRVEMEHECAVGWQFERQSGERTLARSGRIGLLLHGGEDTAHRLRKPWNGRQITGRKR